MDNQAGEGAALYASDYTRPEQRSENCGGCAGVIQPARTFRSIPKVYSSIIGDSYAGIIELSGVNLLIPQVAGYEFRGAVDGADPVSRQDMKLGEYRNHGIGKGIIPLQSGSPAIGAIEGFSELDQLGRPCQGACDLGASEYQSIPTDLIQGLNPNRLQGVTRFFGENGPQNLPEDFGLEGDDREGADRFMPWLIPDAHIPELNFPQVRLVEILDAGDAQEPDFQVEDDQGEASGVSAEGQVLGGGCSLNTQGSPVTDFGILGFLIFFIAGTFRFYKVR